MLLVTNTKSLSIFWEIALGLDQALTVTTLLVPITNTMVPATYTESTSVFRVVVLGLDHQVITATTFLALSIGFPANAITTSDIPVIALVLVSGHLTTTVITLRVLVTSTVVIATNAWSMSVVQDIAVGSGRPAAIFAITTATTENSTKHYVDDIRLITNPSSFCVWHWTRSKISRVHCGSRFYIL